MQQNLQRLKPKGIVFVGPVMMRTTKEALEERRKNPLPKKGGLVSKEDAYQPLAMHGHERLSVIRDLKNHGYSPLIPIRLFDLKYNPQLKTFVRKAIRAGAKITPTELMLNPIEKRANPLLGMAAEATPSASWIADVHRVIGNEVHTCDFFLNRTHLRRVGFWGKIRNFSSAGESGAIVGHGKVLLVTKKVLPEDVNYLRRKGHRVYVMPTFRTRGTFYYRPNALRPEKDFNWRTGKTVGVIKREAHLDYRINIIEKARLLIVDRQYYGVNKNRIIKIAMANNFRIEVVGERELLPTNFLWLPDGKILINKSETLRRILEKHGLKETKDFVVSSTPVKYNRYLGGGIGCFATAMPLSRTKPKFSSWRLKRSRPNKTAELTADDLQEIPSKKLKSESYFVSEKTGFVYYSFDDLLNHSREEHTRSKYSIREYKQMHELAEKLFSCGFLSKKARVIQIGKRKYFEHNYSVSNDFFKRAVPSKEIIDALRWLQKHEQNSTFRNERDFNGIDTTITNTITVNGITRDRTPEDERLETVLSRLGTLGVVKMQMLEGNVFDGKYKFSLVQIPDNWLHLLK